MNLMTRRLQILHDTRELVAVYVNTDDRDRFFAGTVDTIGEDVCILGLVGRTGKSEGYRLQEFARIIHIAWGTEQLRNLAQYSRAQTGAYPANWEELLAHMQVEGRLVCLRDEYEALHYGQVLAYDEKTLQLSRWTLHGGPDGEMILDRSEITAMMFGSEELEQATLTYQLPH